MYIRVCVCVCLYWTSALSSSRCFWPLSSALICVRHLRLWSSSRRPFDSLSSPWIIPYCCFFWLSSSATDSWLGTHLALFSVEISHDYNLTAIEGWQQNGTKRTKSPLIRRKMARGWILKLFCADLSPKRSLKFCQTTVCGTAWENKAMKNLILHLNSEDKNARKWKISKELKHGKSFQTYIKTKT